MQLGLQDNAVVEESEGGAPSKEFSYHEEGLLCTILVLHDYLSGERTMVVELASKDWNTWYSSDL